MVWNFLLHITKHWKKCFHLVLLLLTVPHWWQAHWLATLGLLCLENSWRALEVIFLRGIFQDTVEGRIRNGTGHTFIQKLFSKKDCLFFSLLSSHFTTLHQPRVFCWVYEEVFLKMTYTSYHSSYSHEEARSLLFKLVNVTLESSILIIILFCRWQKPVLSFRLRWLGVLWDW